jgi:Glycosyl transferase family 2
MSIQSDKVDQDVSNPLVSIGLPVYNEERFIRQTIESLLAQDYQNIELIISDNCSTDATETICRSFAASDRRVRYERSEQNLGAFTNFNQVFELASGKYFMWAGAHDLWGTTFVSRALPMLEQDPQLVMVYPRAVMIDAAGNQFGNVEESFETGHSSAVERYLELIWKIPSGNMFHGLIRRQALPRGGIKRVWGADIILLAELSLQGAFAQIPEVLFYRREVRPEEVHDAEGWKKRALETVEGPQPSQKQQMSLEELFREMRDEELKLIWRSRLSPADKLRGLLQTVKCSRTRYGVRVPADAVLRVLTAMRSPQGFFKKVRARINRRGPDQKKLEVADRS